MTDEAPEIVASADLTPVSPSPLHNTYTLPKVLPDLQVQAENPDVVPPDPTTFRTAAAAMAPEPVHASHDTIVVGGDSDSEADASQSRAGHHHEEGQDQDRDESIPDDDSFDAYGEDDNGQEQKPDAAAAAATASDDYAQTFDSPVQEHAEVDAAEQQQQHQQGQEQEHDKPSKAQAPAPAPAPESMNIPEMSDTMPSQSAVAPVSADSPTPILATDGPLPIPPTNPTTSASLAEPEPALAAPATEISQSQAAQPSATAAAPLVPAPTPVASALAQPSAFATSQSEQAGANVMPIEGADATQGAAGNEPAETDVQMEDDSTAIDIQKLVDEITAKADAPAPQAAVPPPVPSSHQDSSTSPSRTAVDPSTLPLINPPLPASGLAQSAPTLATQTLPSASAAAPAQDQPASTGLRTQHAAVAASGTAPGISPVAQNFQASPYEAATSPFASYPNNQTFAPAGAGQGPASAPSRPTRTNSKSVQQLYDKFLADERKYMSEAKWERFPEGSRIFIGNLSQERVSKRDVFDLFHVHGRLAQISLKSAYGFVQYHTVADAQSAMNNLQGAEIKGRKINLEISRTQKQRKDKDNSPDRRGRERGRADRYDGRDSNRRSRDDYRPNRSPSPRRNDARGREDLYGRDRGHYESYSRKNNRSRSPDRFGRNGQDSYRRRSSSPYSRSRQESDGLGIPRRYGSDVPDVQILLLQEVHKDFIDWVQRAFKEAGLKVNTMHLHPRLPRDAVLQRQVLEGVHGVVELDLRAQQLTKIPLQVFDRSAGSNNVRYDQYQDLEPSIAAQLVLRTRSSVASQPAYPPQPTGYQPPPYQQYPGLQQPPQQPAAGPELTGLLGQLGQLDNSTLQTLLASIQGQTSTANTAARQAAIAQAAPHPTQVAQNPQVDINALLSNLSAAAAVPAGAPPAAVPSSMPGYGAPSYSVPGHAMPPAIGHGAPAPGGGDPSQQVQNIMAQLARIRQ